jgi:hypothetical protein
MRLELRTDAVDALSRENAGMRARRGTTEPLARTLVSEALDVGV